VCNVLEGNTCSPSYISYPDVGHRRAVPLCRCSPCPVVILNSGINPPRDSDQGQRTWRIVVLHDRRSIASVTLAQDYPLQKRSLQYPVVSSYNRTLAPRFPDRFHVIFCLLNCPAAIPSHNMDGRSPLEIRLETLPRIRSLSPSFRA
jgi:hypothetical protein